FGSVFSAGCNGSLHSFPTRRSSDLIAWPLSAGDHRTWCRSPWRFTGARPAHPADRRSRFGAPGYGEGVSEPDPARGPAAIERPEDRKSTRLNSSHVKISYAVFCLKK